MGGFHAGELAVQDRAGVRRQAARLEGMLAEPDLDGGAGKFLAAQRFAVVTARDADGTLWTSPLVGPPGFLDAHMETLAIHALPRPGDPLQRVVLGAPLGMVAIDLPARRRMRVNGTVGAVTDHGLLLDVTEAYGNCPKYLHAHPVEPGPGGPTGPEFGGDLLQPAHVRLVEGADTFFLGTVHPERGVDSSHRGGDAGFVRVEAGRLSWPDLPGNNMFNSLGNLAVDPSAALLFLDFDTGATLHLTGTAAVRWSGAERRVEFTPARVVTPAAPVPMRV